MEEGCERRGLQRMKMILMNWEDEAILLDYRKRRHGTKAYRGVMCALADDEYLTWLARKLPAGCCAGVERIFGGGFDGLKRTVLIFLGVVRRGSGEKRQRRS